MTHAAATTNYVFDPHGGSLVRMLVRIDSTGKKTRYVYGVGLDYEVDQTASQAKFYHYDFTGATAAMTNQSGTVTDRLFYTPYGQVTHTTGTSDTPFKFGGFLGIITDPNNLLSMRARFYSPVLSRFVSMDPAKFEGGLNWYAYASGNPLTLGDPTGFGSESTLDAIQTGLSVLGMVPVVGFAFDLVNAGISVARGDYADATLNLFSAIPGIGDVAAGAKLAAGAGAAYGAYKVHDALYTAGYRFSGNLYSGIPFPTKLPTSSGVTFNNGWRTANGKFASPAGPGRAGAAAEQSVWDAVRNKPGWNVVEGRVSVRNASGQLRVYDGAAVSPRNRVIGLEVKSGSATKTPAQRTFDSGVSAANPAIGVGDSRGLNVGKSLQIRR